MKIEMRTVLTDFSLSEDTMKKIASVLRYAAEQEGVPSVYTVTLGFTDDARIRRFNGRFRDLDRATDVLSFPMTAGREEWQAQTGVLLPGLDRPSLGDILISLEHCASQPKNTATALSGKSVFWHSTVFCTFWVTTISRKKTGRKWNPPRKPTFRPWG